ncbi:MAG: 1-acyl-sn-glycerol-3-phosphate acyltransferase, partial [Candidatus Caccosoma sp.]|nr:1-acyl-sn-glycerol-3-phosphate acyltransferase [Candidatus Caccosoma sp.]
IFNDVANDIKNGKNYLIFPEGYYKDNKNTLQDFHSGCLNVVYQSKCPIVPICLYDTYKVYNVNSLKKVSCEVHYLKPIYYDEYCNLRKHELIKLVKSRIQEKIDELNNKNATK